jgi:hypothetical protein
MNSGSQPCQIAAPPLPTQAFTPVQSFCDPPPLRSPPPSQSGVKPTAWTEAWERSTPVPRRIPTEMVWPTCSNMPWDLSPIHPVRFRFRCLSLDPWHGILTEMPQTSFCRWRNPRIWLHGFPLHSSLQRMARRWVPQIHASVLAVFIGYPPAWPIRPQLHPPIWCAGETVLPPTPTATPPC